tara:strand:- start:266 stop:484 length:219 start_codon:yes stop_codon:yes gene_type:complete
VDLVVVMVMVVQQVDNQLKLVTHLLQLHHKDNREVLQQTLMVLQLLEVQVAVELVLPAELHLQVQVVQVVLE